MKNLKLRNNQLDVLLKILSNDLPFSQSRKRKVFVDLILANIRAREAARMVLLDKFGKKDGKGKLVLVDKKYQLEDTEEFSKEFLILINEEVVIDITPSIEESLKLVEKLIRETDVVVSNDEAGTIEEIIKSFDEIQG